MILGEISDNKKDVACHNTSSVGQKDDALIKIQVINYHQWINYVDNNWKGFMIHTWETIVTEYNQ